MADAMVEVRDYTIEPEHFPAYRTWAIDLAAPWLKANLDVIDFWLDDGIPAEVAGSAPDVSSHGQSNVCWIIRWPDKATRDNGWAALGAKPGWSEIWDQHPCRDAYLQINVRFMKAA